MATKRTIGERLDDMLTSIEEAQHVISEVKNLKAYRDNLVVRRALEHCLQNVSEAA